MSDGREKRQDMQLYIRPDHNGVKQKLFMQTLGGNTKTAHTDCISAVGLWVVLFSCYLFVFQAVYKKHILLVFPDFNFILQ